MFRTLRRAAAVCIATALLSGCSLLPKEEEMMDPPAFQKKEEKHETATVKRGNLAKYLSSTATAESVSSTSIFYTESGGRLKKLYVQEGDKVQAGALVAELDTGDLPLKLRLQKLTVEQKRLDYEDALKKTADESDRRLAKIDFDRENLVLQSLEKQYEQALLHAPVDGIVTYVDDLKPGDSIEAQTTIASIADPDHIHLIYTTTEPSSLKAIQPGTEVEIKFDGKSYKGNVTQTPASAPPSDDQKVKDKNARALLIEFDAPKPTVQIGDYADIRLFVEKRDNVLYIPRSALKNFLGRTYVQVLDKGRIKEMDVEAGLMTSDGVEIIKGLEEGMQVITDS